MTLPGRLDLLLLRRSNRTLRSLRALRVLPGSLELLPFWRVSRTRRNLRAGLVLPACLLLLLVAVAGVACAQTGGQGAISGTVADTTGAVIAKATVVAQDVATGVATTRTTSSDGVYNVAPLIPGTYTLTVSATGFNTFKQENLIVDALSNLGLNVSLKSGSQSETVTVTAAPPALDTTSATLGGVIENSLYTELPIMITGSQQRDVTQFSNLLPGAQVNPGGRSSIIGGTGQRLGELYLDGLPITTLSQQGDNRPVFNVVPLEAIDQIKVVTTGFSAEYQGAGLENYNTKAGTNKYHGSAFAFVRNTIFDAWSFTTKPGSPGNRVSTGVVNGAATFRPGPKPPEHQVEFGYAVGGPVKIPFLFNGHDKLFFYTTYDKFRSRLAPNPISSTVPTSLMRTGNFQELLSVANGGLGNTANVNYPIYDPMTLASCSAHSTDGPCRYQYGYGPGTGSGAGGGPVKTGAPINVIPPGQLSPISQYQQSALPAPTFDQVGNIQNNYFGGPASGYDNWLYSGRIDYVISSRQTLAMVLTGGNRHAVPYTASSTASIPFPYLPTTASTVAGHWADLEYTFLLTPNLVNQFKYGFMNFGGPPVQNLTQGSAFALSASGITGLAAGQASDDAANTSFGGTNSPSPWVGNTPTSTSVSETYTMLDNLQWLKGKHSMNFGGQYQWLENNASTADGPSTPTAIAWNPSETGSITPKGTTYVTNTGYSYASFLIGAVGTTSATLQPYTVIGGRFHPFAFYFQDDFKATSKLTLNLGLRWDYIPTYTEAHDRWSFLNPAIANPVTGNLGALQFAGNRGTGISCNCRTPVKTYYKNFGPRLGFAYAVNEKTVFRGGFGILYSHTGGTGGSGGAATGTGQLGFNSTASFAAGPAGPGAGPAFYLNNNPAFSGANANFGGPGYVLPGIAPITATSQTLGTGYYACTGQSYSPCKGNTTAFAGIGTGINYADPYLAGRAPEFAFFNFGMERQVTRDITVGVNYVGSQSHFIAGAGNIRGLQSGQIDPKWLALGNVGGVNYLSKAATAANLALLSAAGYNLPVPYAGYTAAASAGTAVQPGGLTGSSATIAHMLTWMPQYSGTTDTFGNNIANANYNAFQLSVAHRASHGLTLNLNYTYSHNIDDAGTQRSGYAIPAAAIATGQSYAANRIDRSLSINSQPQNLSVYGVYKLPFGKDHLGGEHLLVRALFGGWDMSHIFQLSSGLPLALVATCNGGTQNVGQGTCMPDIRPGFAGSVRVNGGWGHGATAANLGSQKYLTANPGDTVNSSLSGTPGTGSGKVACAASAGPFCDSGTFMIGDAPRTAPYGLRGPNLYRLTSAVHRTFEITEQLKFILGVDCQNVTNHTTFGSNASNNSIGVNVDNAAFGTLGFASADARAFQFSGRLAF